MITRTTTQHRAGHRPDDGALSRLDRELLVNDLEARAGDLLQQHAALPDIARAALEPARRSLFDKLESTRVRSRLLDDARGTSAAWAMNGFLASLGATLRACALLETRLRRVRTRARR